MNKIYLDITELAKNLKNKESNKASTKTLLDLLKAVPEPKKSEKT